MKIDRSPEFDLALKFINETNANVYLTGKAGAGKTTFLKYLKDHPVKNMAIAAPTGVAAINAGGVTLHSLFHLPFGPFLPGPANMAVGYDRKLLLSRLKYNKDKIQFFNALELLVIDEASMVAANTVDAIDTILRHVRHKQIPFGGVQVLFIGDLYQLQPVIRDDEAHVLKVYYSSNFFFDSLVLKNNIPVMIELKKIYRQKDQHFIDILNGLRENTLTPAHLKALNERLDPDFVTKEGDGYITLTTHNDNANRINLQKLKSIHLPEYSFEAEIEGDFPEHLFPAEQKLILKRNAQVMFIKNDTEEKRFFNGKIGIIDDISDEEIIVKCDDEYITVDKMIWENISYSTNEKTREVKSEVRGKFKQYPLRLAWAITIHKSQGLTFEKVIIDSERAFANGQVYVALSRATSLEGLILTSPVNDRFLGGHNEFHDWKQSHHDDRALPILFEKARKEYYKQMVFEVFDLSYFNNLFVNLKKEALNYIYKEDEEWFVLLKEKHEALAEISFKFKQQLQFLWNENIELEKNEKLIQRIKEGAVYFHEKITELHQLFSSHQFSISNFKEAKPIDRMLNDIHEKLLFLLIKTDISKNFTINALMEWKKNIPKSLPKIKSSYETKRRNDEEQDDIHHEVKEESVSKKGSVSHRKHRRHRKVK